MSGYGRGPNVSQYIANLNSISSNNEAAQENGNLDDELAYFTNAELFDFDYGVNEGPAQNFSVEANHPKADGTNGGAAGFNGGFDDFLVQQTQPLHLNTNFAATNNFDPQLFQSPQSATFGPQTNQQQSQKQSSNDASDSQGAAGGKRTRSATSPSSSVEDAARNAAEEDKRRRNTAASARFRVKKKQREAALEKTAKEMTDKVDQLEKRVAELEMENKWLRGIVVEKGMNVKVETDSQDAKEASGERIAEKQIKRGVGTKAENASNV